MLVSVVIPTYNRATFLATAIDSVLGQLVPGDELIVVDDGSDDDTPAVLSKYGGRITVIQGEHGGAGRARNLGIERATNDYVAFLDSDDVWLPHKLQVQRNFMGRRPDLLFSFTNFEVELSDGSVRRRYLDRWPRDQGPLEQCFGTASTYLAHADLPPGIEDFPVYEGDLYSMQLRGFYVLTDTLMARRREAGNALHFAEDVPTYEDLECFYRLSQRGRGALLDLDTTRQRDHPHGRLSQRAQLDKLDAHLTLMRRIWGSDADFLRRCGSEYRQALDQLLAQKAGLLLSRGNSRMARATLDEMAAAPLVLSLLASFPGGVTKAGLALRRMLRGRGQ